MLTRSLPVDALLRALSSGSLFGCPSSLSGGVINNINNVLHPHCLVESRKVAPEVGLSPRRARGSTSLGASHSGAKRYRAGSRTAFSSLTGALSRIAMRSMAPEVGLSPRQARGSASLGASHSGASAIALAVELRSRLLQVRYRASPCEAWLLR